MFSQRWSTFSLLSLTLTTGLSFFLIGRLSIRDRHMREEVVDSRFRNQFKDSRDTTKPVSTDAPSEAPTPEIDWTRLSTQARTPAVETDIVAMIEKIAETDPQRALSLAQVENNFRLRVAMLRAALRGWGKMDADAAASWVQSQTVMDRDQAAGALLQGVIQNPGKATSVTATLMQNDPGHAGQYGSDLIWAFADAGQFSQAASFAANGAENNRSDWMLAAYSRWAEFQPQFAVADAMQLHDPALQRIALDAVVVGWSPTDPRGMAEYALKNLPPDQQNAALSRALSFWADSDPAAAAAWINEKKLGAPSDAGVAEIAMSPELAQAPDVAASWARTITDPILRSRTLVSILQGWAHLNPVAAKRFLETSTDVQVDDLSNLLAEMNTP